MKFLIFSNDSTGITDFRMELLSELLRKGEVVVATPNNGTVNEITGLGVRVVEMCVDRRGINPIKDLILVSSMLKILMIEKPDFVITYTIKRNVYGGVACRIVRIPYAVNVTGLGTAFQGAGMLRNMVSMLYKVGCKKAKVVFFENSENRQIFINEGIIREAQACLLDGAGVNLDYYQVTEYPTDDKIHFLFIGRIMKEKGIDELFKAMRMLNMGGISCSLDVLGGFDEDYNEKIKEYESEGWMTYYGYQNDIRPFIANCHCFVLPSWHEGMANTNLECAASGRPVITSNIHGCLEAVEDGVTGYLCEKQNVNDLYRVMRQFAKLPYEKRKDMGLAGRKRMENIFDKKKVVRETLKAIDKR